jgi:NADPH2:quinone reductase
LLAVVCESFGPFEGIVIEERPSGEVGSGEVRLRVTAAGVNFVDALIVQGLYQIKPLRAFVAGGESAGVVSEVGEGVTSLGVGDRVPVTPGLGGFATEIVMYWVLFDDIYNPSKFGKLLEDRQAAKDRASP